MTLGFGLNPDSRQAQRAYWVMLASFEAEKKKQSRQMEGEADKNDVKRVEPREIFGGLFGGPFGRFDTEHPPKLEATDAASAPPMRKDLALTSWSTLDLAVAPPTSQGSPKMSGGGYGDKRNGCIN
ncbi:hypothetical protein K432DRAFT_394013 [Lepidopterella palustris CBS 459.81]|uniref:Uncharacterized protein n=1 Tax=Lepidopterella palustris CBS 459.81 TaxID=1314670 RepID=A0A8E2JED1_9PEZI|nr:hypothetical protein K432DRAFT_394013 [Lepidopterella palustris CBS 459.81]